MRVILCALLLMTLPWGERLGGENGMTEHVRGHHGASWEAERPARTISMNAGSRYGRVFDKKKMAKSLRV